MKECLGSWDVSDERRYAAYWAWRAKEGEDDAESGSDLNREE